MDVICPACAHQFSASLPPLTEYDKNKTADQAREMTEYIREHYAYALRPWAHEEDSGWYGKGGEDGPADR